MDPQFAHRRSYSMTRPLGAAAAEISLGLGEFARLAKSMAAYVGEIVSSIFEPRSPEPAPPATRRITPRPIKPPPPEALPLLTEAIVGSSKFTIASVLGAPRSAMVEGLAEIEQSADAAYYRTDSAPGKPARSCE